MKLNCTHRFVGLALAAGLWMLSPAALAAETISLLIGQQEIYSGEEIERVSIGNDAIASVTISKDQSQMVLTGLAPGVTSLNLWMKDGRRVSTVVEVLAYNVEEVKSEIGEILRDAEGLSLRTVGHRVVLEGSIDDEAMLDRIHRVAEMYGGQAVDFTQLHEGAFNPTPMIQLEFSFIEIANEDGYQLGINWPDGINAEASGISFEYQRNFAKPKDQEYTLFTSTNTEGNIDVRIGPTMGFDFAGIEGEVQVMDIHKMTIRSGEPAEYESGGEMNVIVRGVNDSKLEKVKFGTIMAVTPTLDRFGRIQIAIDATVSELDNGSALEGVPGLLSRKIKTVVDLKEGQSLALVGLTRKADRQFADGIPFLMDIPVLGWLFRTEGVREIVNDGIIFITPRVLHVQSPENLDMIHQMKTRFNENREPSEE